MNRIVKDVLKWMMSWCSLSDLVEMEQVNQSFAQLLRDGKMFQICYKHECDASLDHRKSFHGVNYRNLAKKFSRFSKKISFPFKQLATCNNDSYFRVFEKCQGGLSLGVSATGMETFYDINSELNVVSQFKYPSRFANYTFLTEDLLLVKGFKGPSGLFEVQKRMMVCLFEKPLNWFDVCAVSETSALITWDQQILLFDIETQKGNVIAKTDSSVQKMFSWKNKYLINETGKVSLHDVRSPDPIRIWNEFCNGVLNHTDLVFANVKTSTCEMYHGDTLQKYQVFPVPLVYNYMEMRFHGDTLLIIDERKKGTIIPCQKNCNSEWIKMKTIEDNNKIYEMEVTNTHLVYNSSKSIMCSP